MFINDEARMTKEAKRLNDKAGYSDDSLRHFGFVIPSALVIRHFYRFSASCHEQIARLLAKQRNSCSRDRCSSRGR